jgi:NAD(P)-dependent dehydrogenase (short-subunit alcohol dehydrogenase family)
MLKVWFITGSSRGLGRALAEAALEKGDRVIATAREPGSLEGLKSRHGERLWQGSAGWPPRSTRNWRIWRPRRRADGPRKAFDT